MFFQSFFFKQKTAYEIMPRLVGSEMCIRDRYTEPLEPDTEVTLTEQGKKIVDRIREQERIGWESVSEFFE